MFIAFGFSAMILKLLRSNRRFVLKQKFSDSDICSRVKRILRNVRLFRHGIIYANLLPTRAPR